jgi:predicted outer membrane protein/sporulation protein YlmC with PRC-barrel domain
MRKTLLATTAVTLLSFGAPAIAQQQPNAQQQNQQQGQQQSQLSQQDRQFVQQAGISNQFEIQAAEIAQDKAGNQQVQQFAQRMIKDHRTVGDRLAAVVQPLNVQVPQQLDEQHRRMIEDLRNMSGDQFDAAYIRGQIDAHNQAVALFEKQSNSGQNQELKRLASDTLPRLREHLTSAQDLSRQVPVASSGGQQQAANQQADGADIQVHQPAPQVTVQQPEPQVTVRQPEPQVTVQQPAPQVTVQQPEPQVTVQQPEPQVTVQQPEPQVTVQESGQPQVTVQETGQPEVNVQETEQANLADPADQAEATSPGMAQGGQQEPMQPRLMADQVGRLIGTNAVTENGEDIGEVQNLLVNSQGQVEALIVEWGGFLGIGAQTAAVPWDRTELTQGGDRLVIAMTREEMEAMPEYNGDPSEVAGIDENVTPLR